MSDGFSEGEDLEDKTGAEAEDDLPVWVPTMLEGTRDRVHTAKTDAAKTGKSCMLCELATGETGCAVKFGEILKLEKDHRRNMKPDILHQSICDKYNSQIVRMLKERFPKRNAREITLSEVRIHFSANHDRDFRRMLEDRLDYFNAAANELERSGLWLRDAKRGFGDEDEALRPDFRNFDIYIKLTSKMRDLYRDMTGLGVSGSSSSSSRVGKGHGR
jgi:hypothetical protein